MIKRLYIKNFRSIKELELFPENLSALIGPNSVGKTNVLKALDLILGEGWATKAKVARELFNDPGQSMEIEVDFHNPVTYMDSYKGEIPVEGVRLKMDLSPLSCVVQTVPHDRYVNDDFKKKCHFIYIPSQRDLSAQMRVTSWTLLGKIMKDVHNNYIEHYGGDEERLKGDLRGHIKPAKEFIEQDFNPDVTTFKNFIDTFAEYCEQNSVGLANKFLPELNIYNLNWFYKTLQIQVTESSGKVFDAEDLGSGLQNLILISIFQTYSKLMGGRVIFGIEEPEIYLYPQAQRSLYESFQELSKNSQIFYTTHNPNFVSASRANEIEILQKTDKAGTFVLEKDTATITKKFLQDNQFKIYANFNTHRNEIFFAKKVLLVEGPSDKILFETLCKEKWNIDLNRHGISIIDCTGKGGVIYFSGVCKLLALNFFAVWDGDGEKPHDLLVENLTENRGLQIEPNLEEFLKASDKSLTFSSESEKKTQQAYEWAKKCTNYPAEFNLVRDFLIDPDVQGDEPVEIKPVEVQYPSEEIDISDIPF